MMPFRTVTLGGMERRLLDRLWSLRHGAAQGEQDPDPGVLAGLAAELSTIYCTRESEVKVLDTLLVDHGLSWDQELDLIGEQSAQAAQATADAGHADRFPALRITAA